MLGERPSLPVSRSIAPDIEAFSSWSARGTRIAHPLSRKWRLISPTIPELAKAASVTEEEVLEALESGRAYSSLSLSAGGGQDEDGELDPLETIGGEDEEFERSEHRAALEPALDRLPAREREILRMRFEEGLPQTQIAQRVGLSQMHVSRLIRKSLSIMREELLRTPPGAA